MARNILASLRLRLGAIDESALGQLVANAIDVQAQFTLAQARAHRGLGADGQNKGPVAIPCQVCSACKEIAAGNDIDVQEREPWFTSHAGR